jgi:hypothetical protein
MAIRRKEKRSERSKLDATPPWEPRKQVEVEPTTGPFDVTDVADDDLARIDLGALQIAPSELEMRVDVDENQNVVSVTVVGETGNMQLGAFAAPRTEGIWTEVRAEIAESVVSQGGKALDETSDFGTDLVGMLPVEGGLTPVRFIGVDGPRWLLRAMLVGGPAVDAEEAAPFIQVLKTTVVVRGNDPLPVREPIPLRLPVEVTDQIAQAAQEQ